MTLLETVTKTLSEHGPYIELETPIQFVIFDGCPATEERRTITALDIDMGKLLVISNADDETTTTEANEFGQHLNVGVLEDLLREVLKSSVVILDDGLSDLIYLFYALNRL